jgi:dCMP deaminase
MQKNLKAIMRPSIEDTLISIAITVSKRSTCSRRNNGAVIADRKGVVLSTGYNGSLSGMPHCDHECDCGAELIEHQTFQGTVREYRHHEKCPAHPNNGCTLAVHAEANAVYFAARNGVSVEGATIYCTTEPCVKCAEAIVQSGIIECWYDQEYRIHAGIELLRAAGVKVYRKEVAYE